MFLGDLIKKYRTANKLSLRDFAKKCGLSHTYISALEKNIDPRTGKPIAPTLDTVKYISKGMNISVEDILKILDSNQEFTINADINREHLDKFGNSVVPIPLLGTVKAGYDYLAEENWEGTKEIKEELAKTGEFFALRIKGDSMFETLWENDIVAVRKQDYADDGDIAVVLINGDEATVKKIRILENGIKLIPLNRRINPETQEPFYEDMFFSKEDIETKPVKIIGVVKQIIERNF